MILLENRIHNRMLYKYYSIQIELNDISRTKALKEIKNNKRYINL